MRFPSACEILFYFDAEVNREQGRPLFGVNGEVCKKVVQKIKKGLDRADTVRDVA